MIGTYLFIGLIILVGVFWLGFEQGKKFLGTLGHLHPLRVMDKINDVRLKDYGFKIGAEKDGWVLSSTSVDHNQYNLYYLVHSVVKNGNTIMLGNDELHYFLTTGGENYLRQIGKLNGL